MLMGFNAALLLSTATVAADLTIPVEDVAVGTAFSLTVGGGVVGYNLPDFELPIAGTLEGPLASSLGGTAYGGIVGVSLSTALDPMGDYATSLNMSGFISLATRSASTSTTLGPDDDTLFIRGITTPDGVITVTTDPATPEAHAEVDAANNALDQTVDAPVNGGGAQNIYATNEPGGAFSYGGAATFAGGTNSAFAFGALATEDGGVFLATGDLEGWVIDTDVTQNLIYLGGDITFALSSNPASGELSVTGYVGPSYRFLGTETTTDISVDVAEIEPTDPADYTFPTYEQSTVENLGTHYLGGIVGASFAIPVSPTSTLTLGAEGGIYYTSTTYDASETYELSGGVPSPVNGTTVENGIEVGSDDNGFAYALRTQGTFTTAVSNSMQVSFGLGAEYLSQVATITRDGTGLVGPTPLADGVSYDGPDSASGSVISYGDAWSWTATVSLTGQF